MKKSKEEITEAGWKIKKRKKIISCKKDNYQEGPSILLLHKQIDKEDR